MRLEVPVEPGADQAREWLVQELAKPRYRAAEPTWFERLASGFWDWLTGLFDNGVAGPPSLLVALIIVVVIAAIVAAYLIFGPPRLNRRSTAGGGVLFGDDDSRDAAAIRAAAERAAAAGDWAIATEEMFRATARGLSERAVLTITPGTTAAGFAERARAFFPDLGGELAASATGFDSVRYLDRPGSEADYRQVAALERSLRTRTPRFESVGVAG